MSVVNEKEFEEWQEHPVTKRLKKQIKKDVDEMKDMLVDTDFDSLREIQGRIKACMRLLEIQYEDLYE